MAVLSNVSDSGGGLFDSFVELQRFMFREVIIVLLNYTIIKQKW